MVDGPLNGVRVLDLTHVWAGPLAGRFLADLGADVVKIEAPFGRGPRVYPDTPLGGWLGGSEDCEHWNSNAIFAKLHRNRRSLCVDLKQNAGRDLLLKLAACADILLENFSARTMQDFGLGHDVLVQANPRLINVSLPGFGADGPYSSWVAFGLTVEAMSGLTQVMGYEDGQTRNSTIALNDPMTATHAAAAAVEALNRRQLTGEGEFIELTLHECGVAFSGHWLVAQQLGETLEPAGNQHPGLPFQDVFRASGDDRWLAVSCADQAMLDRLGSFLSCDSLSLPVVLERWVAERDVFEACNVLQAQGIAAGVVSGVDDMLADPQARERGFFSYSERTGETMPGNPIQMSGLDSRQWTRCPDLGEDNAAVLSGWLDLPETEVHRLMKAGILADQPPG